MSISVTSGGGTSPPPSQPPPPSDVQLALSASPNVESDGGNTTLILNINGSITSLKGTQLPLSMSLLQGTPVSFGFENDISSISNSSMYYYFEYAQINSSQAGSSGQVLLEGPTSISAVYLQGVVQTQQGTGSGSGGNVSSTGTGSGTPGNTNSSGSGTGTGQSQGSSNSTSSGLGQDFGAPGSDGAGHGGVVIVGQGTNQSEYYQNTTQGWNYQTFNTSSTDRYGQNSTTKPQNGNPNPSAGGTESASGQTFTVTATSAGYGAMLSITVFVVGLVPIEWLKTKQNIKLIEGIGKDSDGG